MLSLTAVHPDIVPDLLENIRASVTVRKKDDTYNMLNVTVNDSGLHEMAICMYVPKSKTIPLIDPVNAFYTTVCCAIADWTVGQINNLVSPLFHQPNTQDSNVYTPESEKQFKMNFNTFKWIIERNVKFFVTAINNLIDTHLYASYYKDTSILKTLTTLRIYTEFLSMAQNDSSSNDGESHFNVLQLFLKHMKELEIFLSMNCSGAPSNLNSSKFFYDWIEPNIVMDNDYIINYPTNTNIKLILVDQLVCSSTQIILNEFVNPSTNNPMSASNASNINQANVIVNKIIVGTVKDILDEIKKSYSIELIILYQNSVLSAILKFLFHQVIYIFEMKLNDYERNALNKIQIVYAKILKEKTKFSEHFVEGFEILHTNAKAESPKVNELKNFYETLQNIQFSNLEAMKVGSLLNIRELLNTIILKIDDFKCIQQSNTFLKDKHYNILLNSKISLSNNYSFPSYGRKICNFIKAVYSVCYKCQMNNDDGINNPLDEVYTKKTFNDLLMIQNYFLYIIKKNIDILGLEKLAYTIVPILLNAITDLDYFNPFETQRILNIVIAELSLHGIQYCSKSKNNLLFFNNTNSLEFGYDKRIRILSRDFFQIFDSNYDSSDLYFMRLGLTRFNYLNLKYLYNSFVKISPVITQYKNHILFIWNGIPKTIHDVFKDTSMFLVNSNHLLALYDIHFKFYIGLIFLEIEAILKNKNINKIQKKFRKLIKVLDNFNQIFFPQYLSLLIKKVKRLMSFSINLSATNKQDILTEIFNYETEIKKEFMDFNVVFDEQSYSPFSFLMNINLKNAFKKLYTVINHEIMTLNIYFEQFKINN